MTRFSVAFLAASCLIATATAGQVGRDSAPAASSLPQLLERAIFTEDTLGDLDAAIAIYREILGLGEAERSYVAQAQFRLAMCFVKKGDSEAAIAALQQLIADFPRDEELVARARTRLAELGVPKEQPDVSVRRLSSVTASSRAPGWSANTDANLLGSPSPDGSFLTTRHRGELAIHDLATGRTRRLTAREEVADTWGVSYSTVSPDGRFVAYSWLVRELTDLRIIGVDGSGERVLLSEPMADVRPAAWTADGREILASWRRTDGDTVIALVGAASGSVRILETLERGAPLGLSISPDSRFVVYDLPSSTDPSQREIFLLSVDNGHRIPLVSHPASDFHPKWTPDGEGILFLSDRGGSAGLWFAGVADGRPTGEPTLVKPDTGSITPMGFTRSGAFYYGVETPTNNIFVATIDPKSGELTLPSAPAIDHFVGRNSSPSFSPDGRSLAYYSRRGAEHSEGNPWRLVIRALDRGTEREITLGLMQYDPPHRPRWRPDGKSVVVTTSFDEQGRGGFYQVDLQTEEATPLVQMPVGGAVEELIWAPDGQTVYYDRHFSDEQVRCVLVARDLSTGKETELAHADPPWGINSVSLSPDGRTLAYPSMQDTAPDAPFSSVIYVMPAAGGAKRELFRAKEKEWVAGSPGLFWTPDGRELIFVTGHEDTGPQREIWKISIEGGTPGKLGVVPEVLGPLSLHPDGHRLAYSTGQFVAEFWVLENFLPTIGATGARRER